MNNPLDKDILYGIQKCEDDLFMNHILWIGKQYIYNCRCAKTNPGLRVFLARVNKVYQIETMIAKSRSKMSIHLRKWRKYCINKK